MDASTGSAQVPRRRFEEQTALHDDGIPGRVASPETRPLLSVTVRETKPATSAQCRVTHCPLTLRSYSRSDCAVAAGTLSSRPSPRRLSGRIPSTIDPKHGRNPRRRPGRAAARAPHRASVGQEMVVQSRAYHLKDALSETARIGQKPPREKQELISPSSRPRSPFFGRHHGWPTRLSCRPTRPPTMV